MKKEDILNNKVKLYTSRIKYHQDCIKYLDTKLKMTLSQMRQKSLDEIRKEFPYLED